MKRFLSCLPIFGCLLLLASFPVFGEEGGPFDCLRCHDDIQSHSSAHEELACHDCHSNVTDRRGHRKTALETLSGAALCAQCHEEAVGNLIHTGHVEEASCADCHGAPHDISLVSAPASLIAPEMQAETCGKCHSDVSDLWHASAHGTAWSKGNAEAPVCTSCHQAHGAATPALSSARQEIPGQCGSCHGDLYSTYRITFHGKSSKLGLERGAICTDCHTPHSSLPASDPRSSVHPDQLGQTCGGCHVDVSGGFVGIDMHNDPTDPEDNVYVYWIYLMMMALLISVFAFFALHDLLWLQRILIGTWRGEFRPVKPGRDTQTYVRRFSGFYVFLHIVVVITFLLLALTGLPIKFHAAPWAQGLIDLLGGVEVASLLHRIAAVGTFGYMVAHLVHLAYRALVRRESGLFWGPNSMVPQLQDIKDLVGNFRYFLYLGPRPEGDRWTYWEKFDYLAVFWGVMIIGLSGLMLWFPAFFTQFLPGWAINAALVVHSDEALLATGFIFVFHLFHTHLRPESFPMDAVVFTGSMTLERFKEERPLEYQRLVERGELDNWLTEPPGRGTIIWSYVFGLATLTVGVLLAVAIFWALLSG